jgi:hypothetical protein
MGVSAGDAWLDVHSRLAADFGRRLSSQVQTPAKRAGEEASRHFGRRFAAGLAIGGAAIGVGLWKATKLARRGISQATDAASDLNETVNKNRVIFGASARAIERWSRGSATSMGLSRQEALANAAAFGDMFLQLKLGRPQAVGMSQRMVELASDFASFHNADITQVLEAQQSAFRGEYDALQRFVPGINAARVEQEALRLSHKKSAQDLTAAEKAQAAYNIMLRDGSRAQGDFSRTAKDNANQRRIARAQWLDLQATLGKAFLPAQLAVTRVFTEKLLPAGKTIITQMAPGLQRGITAAATALAGAVPPAGQLADGARHLGDRLGAMLAKGRDLPAVARDLADRFKDVWPQLRQTNLHAADLGGTLTIGAAALRLVADHADTLAKHLPLLVAAFVAYKGVQAAAQAADVARVALLPAQIAGNFALARSQKALTLAIREQGGATLAQTTAEKAGLLMSLRARAATIAQAVAQRVVALASKAWAAAQWLINAALTANPIGLVIAAIALLVAGVIYAYKHSETFRKIVDGAFRKVAAAAVWLKDHAVAAFKAVVGWISDTVTWIRGLPGRAWTALQGFAGKLRERAREGFQALLDKAKEKWTAIKEWASRLPGSFVNAMGDLGKALVGKFSGAVKKVLEFLGIKSPSKVFADIGRQMIAGLAEGIAGKMRGIPDLLGKLRDMAGAALFGGPTVGRMGYGSNRALVKALAERLYGWVGSQWIALANLIAGESGFNNLAQNPTSSAFGMFQFLNDTWSSVGARKTADPYAQTVAGLRYIAGRYGTPAAAYGAWLGRTPHWYAKGYEGVISTPTLIGVGEAGPEAVSVKPLHRRDPATGPVELAPASIRSLGRVVVDGMLAAGVGATYLDSRRVEQVLAGAAIDNRRR